MVRRNPPFHAISVGRFELILSVVTKKGHLNCMIIVLFQSGIKSVRVSTKKPAGRAVRGHGQRRFRSAA